MKKKVKLADVLWDAANNYLPPTDNFTLDVWSCNAALHAEFRRIPFRSDARGDEVIDRRGSACEKFLLSLGCRGHHLHGAFGDFPPGRLRQGVRYMWLLLAMHVAEDEGIEIEVQS